MLKFKTTTVIFLAVLLLLVAFDWKQRVSPFLYVMVLLGYIGIVSYGVSVISSQFFIPALWKGSGKMKSIAITFDDGPIPGNTERVLKILEEHHVPAAFFCIGERVKKHPELVTEIHDRGHLIGNHSYKHASSFDLQSTASMLEELQQTDAVIQNITGSKPRFFRPPYGVTNPNLARAIRKGGYITIGWSVRSFDTMTKDKKKLFNRVTRHLKAGDVILFHDYCEVTLQLLPEFLTHVKNLGLNIVRLDAHLNERAYV